MKTQRMAIQHKISTKVETTKTVAAQNESRQLFTVTAWGASGEDRTLGSHLGIDSTRHGILVRKPLKLNHFLARFRIAFVLSAAGE